MVWDAGLFIPLRVLHEDPCLCTPCWQAPVYSIRLHFGQRSVAVLMIISDRRHTSQYQHLAHWETGPAGLRTLHFVAHMEGYMLQDTDNSKISLLFAAALYFLVHKSTVNECHE